MIILAIAVASGFVLFAMSALTGAVFIFRRAGRYNAQANETLRNAQKHRTEGDEALARAKATHANCAKPQVIALQIPPQTMPQFAGPRGVA